MQYVCWNDLHIAYVGKVNHLNDIPEQNNKFATIVGKYYT